MSDQQPETVAWFHCFSGIAGDMALGTLIDAGADVDEIRLLLRAPRPAGLGAPDRGRRSGAAWPARGRWSGRATTWWSAPTRHIAALITGANLPGRVADRSLAVFHRLAEVESALHRRPIDQVHFHEVGGHDAIIDIVGTAAALEVLGVDEVTASPVATGTGMVRTAHGLLPNPSPGRRAPARGRPHLRPRHPRRS